MLDLEIRVEAGHTPWHTTVLLTIRAREGNQPSVSSMSMHTQVRTMSAMMESLCADLLLS